MIAPFTFCIDTDAYAGNFERELTAFATGRVGECNIGSEAAEITRKDLGQELMERLEDLVMDMSDHHGCHRPTACGFTPKNLYRTKIMEDNQTVEIYLNHLPPEDLRDLICARALIYAADPSTAKSGITQEPMKILGFRLVRSVVITDTPWKMLQER